MERRLNWLGTTCALNGYTAYLPANQNPVFSQTTEWMNEYIIILTDYNDKTKTFISKTTLYTIYIIYNLCINLQ